MCRTRNWISKKKIISTTSWRSKNSELLYPSLIQKLHRTCHTFRQGVISALYFESPLRYNCKIKSHQAPKTILSYSFDLLGHAMRSHVYGYIRAKHWLSWSNKHNFEEVKLQAPKTILSYSFDLLGHAMRSHVYGYIRAKHWSSWSNKHNFGEVKL